MIPYPSYPYIAAAHPDQQANAAVPQAPTPVKGKPPLRATGFIQGEHGALIPVYQPDALDQYMTSTATTGQAPSQDQAQESVQMHSQSLHGQAQGAAAAAIWANYQPQPQIYAYQMAAAAAATQTMPPAVQQQLIHQQVHGHSLTSPNPVSWTAPQQYAAFPAQQLQQQSMSGMHMQSSQHQYTNAPNFGTPPRGGPYLGQGHSHSYEQRPHPFYHRHPPRRDASHAAHGRNNNNLGGSARDSPSRRTANVPASIGSEHHFGAGTVHAKQDGLNMQRSFNQQSQGGGNWSQ